MAASWGRDAHTFIGDDCRGCCGITRGYINHAQTVGWTGAISSDWFTPGNWTAPGVPTGATSALIDTVVPNATVVGTAGATASALNVGQAGTGMLTIQSGGTLSSGSTAVGLSAGSQGTVTVTGVGSTWTATPTQNIIGINVGQVGTGMLTIQSGGTVSSGGQSTVGVSAGSQGTVTVTGAGSTWTGNVLVLGLNGRGTLTIADGGTVNSPVVAVAVGAGSIGTLNIGAGPGNPTLRPARFQYLQEFRSAPAPAPSTSITRPPTTCFRP